MKQKIVIEVQVRCKKCWSKAMKIVSVAEGEIFSVAWEGEDKDKMVVIGDGVDAATLAENLRKKLGWANLLLVEEVKVKPDPPKPDLPKPDPPKPTPPSFTPPYCPCNQQLYVPVVVYEDQCTSTCNIM